MEHAALFLGGLQANPLTRRTAAEALLGRFEEVVDRFKEGMGLEYVISSGLSGLSTWADYERLRAFFEVGWFFYVDLAGEGWGCSSE